MLELARVNAFYGQSHILHDVDFRLESLGRLAVLGRNGAGKTTLLKSIMNAGPSVTGTIHLGARDLSGLSPSQRSRLGLSLVPEDRRIFGHLTAHENLVIAQYGAASDRELWPIRVLRAHARRPIRWRRRRKHHPGSGCRAEGRPA